MGKSYTNKLDILFAKNLDLQMTVDDDVLIVYGDDDAVSEQQGGGVWDTCFMGSGVATGVATAEQTTKSTRRNR